MVQQCPYNRPTTPPGLRKRRIPSDSIQPLETPDHRSPKRQKLSHPAFPPSKFWDDLSEIPLTRNSLRELNDRNAEVSRGSSRTRSRRISIQENGCFQHSNQFLDHPNQFLNHPDQFLNQCLPTYLKQITCFAKHGGPDLRDLRGYRIPTGTVTGTEMSSSLSSLGRRKRSSPLKRGSQSPSKSNNTPNTTTTKSTGPYDRAFQQHLIDHNILPDGYEYPDGQSPPEPENIDEILRTLSQPRASLSPSRFSNDDFRKFKRVDTQASKERKVMTTVIPIVEGDVGDTKCVAGEIPFTNLDHLTNGTLVPGNPDLYYGARPEQLDRRIRMELGSHIMPSTQEDLPIAPNFFVEVKGPDGSIAVAMRQLSYDMALGARGLNTLQTYNSSTSVYGNKAYTLGCTYQHGHLQMYTSQPIPPSAPGRQSGYVMTQLGGWSLTGNLETFRQGAAAYRNGRDWTKRQRDDAIKQANKRTAGDEVAASSEGDSLGLSFASEALAGDPTVTSQETALNPGSNVPPSYESETSADELSLDFQPPAKRSK